MKKAMALLMAISLVMPLASVKAIEGNYFVYGKGDQVNFYVNEDDQKKGESTQDAGMTTIILKDEGKDSEYVKVLATGFKTTKSNAVFTKEGMAYKEGLATNSPIRTVIDMLGKAANPVQVPYVKDLDESVGFITLDELIDVFGAKKNDDGTYTIDPDKTIGTYSIRNAEAFEEIADLISELAELANVTLEAGGSRLRYGTGFYTSTTTEKGAYAVIFEFNSKEEIKSITVKDVAFPEEFPADQTAIQTEYYLVPTLMMNKTYDCHEHKVDEPKKSYSCYLCDDEYVWTEDGKQDASCKVAKKITSKSKCVKIVETGVSEYIAEFIGVVGICGIAVILIKRKDLFKSI